MRPADDSGALGCARHALRRTLALATCALAVCAPVLTSCGFDYATDRIYTPAAGVNNREASVDVLGAVIVSAEEGSGVFVASFANNSTEEPATVEALEGVDQSQLAASDSRPIEVPPGGLVNLADEGGIEVTGEVAAGEFVPVAIQFGNGERVQLDVPVVTNCGVLRRPRRPALPEQCEPEIRRAPPSTDRSMTATLILLRHGESEWNAKNLFTGWVDVALTEKGAQEAVRGGVELREAGLRPDVVHTSVQRRAISTACLALDAADRHWIPVRRSWRLNERHYGALQGKDKKQTLEQYGEEQFMLWRRSFDVAAAAAGRRRRVLPGGRPPLRRPRRRAAAHRVPQGRRRAVPALLGVRHRPRPAGGEDGALAAHGNSLRALVKHLDGISDEDIAGLNIPTGMPLVYQLDESMAPERRRRRVPRPRGRRRGRRRRRQPGPLTRRTSVEVG